MTQAIEIPKLPLCNAPRASWVGRLRAKLFGSPAPHGIIPLEPRSSHLLRDIGLSDNPRTNHLFQDDRLFRR